MPEEKDMKIRNIKTEKKKRSSRRKTDGSRKGEQHTEPTANELMFIAWQKIYENRHNRLL